MQLGRIGLAIAGLALLAVGQARAAPWVSPAPDVVLYAPPSLAHAMRQVAQAFGAARHVKVHVFASPPESLAGLIAHRARDDVVVEPAAALDRLAAAGLLRPGTRVAVAADAFVLAIPTADLAPPCGMGIAPTAVVVTDPTPAAGLDGRALLAADDPALAAGPVIEVADIAAVIARLRRGPHLAGVLPASAIDDGNGLIGSRRLSAPPERIDAAVVRTAQSGNAGALLAFLATPEAQDVLHRAGLDPAPTGQGT